jgi:hypothetical protein
MLCNYGLVRKQNVAIFICVRERKFIRSSFARTLFFFVVTEQCQPFFLNSEKQLQKHSKCFKLLKEMKLCLVSVS